MKRENGFTLIEIVIVMVILGVLAIVAIPKFSDLTTTAKIAATQSALGSIRSILSVEYMNRAVAGNATFPTSLGTANFADHQQPVNKLTGRSGVSSVASVPAGTATDANVGFWFITSSGVSGAYSDGTLDTGNW